MTEAIGDLEEPLDAIGRTPDRQPDQNPERPTSSYRPALVAMTNQVRGLIDEFTDGFSERRRILSWTQEMTTRTLGELPDLYYSEVTRAVRQKQQGALMGALLVPAMREVDLDEDSARELRERIATAHIQPAYHRAFRRLRNDATEYVADADEDAQHNPEKQRHVAMRPALDELEQWQQRALSRCLDGLDSRSDIPDWGEDLELATHGEVADDFISRCYRERSTWQLLTDSSPAAERGREVFAAAHLLPAFRRGTRTLSGRAGELPETEREVSTAKMV